MWRGSGAVSRSRGGAAAVDEIKARRRQQEWALRKARREKQLVSKRLLRELQDDGEEMEIREPLVTQDEVSQLYQRIQRGSEDRVTALRSLCQLLHQREAQKMFVSLENSIHVLIGLFTSNLASVQLEAARCLLKLSHASDPSISLVCLPATPYLLTYLSGQSAKFTEQCLYILGNMAAENEAVRSQLLLQGVIQALATCLQSPHEAVVEAAAYSLSQLLQAKEAGEKIVPAVLEASLTPRLIHLLDPDSEFGMPTAVESAWCLHYIVSSGVNCECLVSQGLVHQAVRLLIALGNAIDSSTTTDGVELMLKSWETLDLPGNYICLKCLQLQLLENGVRDLEQQLDELPLLIYPVARCLGNLTASCESVLSRDRLLDWRVLQALSSIINKFLQSHQSLTRECLWLLNNLTAADDQLCSTIFSLDLVPMVLQLMLFSGGINTLVLILLGNIAEKGPAHCDRLQQHKELFPALCSTLRAADAEVVRLSLEVLNLIFSHCVQASAEFVNQNGIPALEAILYNNNEEIRVRANFLMDRYFTDKAV